MSAKVIIELELNPREGEKVLNSDVYGYLEDLIYEESLDYTVYHGGKQYGVLDYRDIRNMTPLQVADMYGDDIAKEIMEVEDE